ncbi:aminotransferase class I/II-fold pyridoxal phosphate-dependent enzyme [Pseudoduganella aquatica]|uniref:Aminotransferase class I/II-fold pyridoxal phosphate-dependent enzyme n=1 Tax=Pseudoduganella aquatica TaxID=2660641 RepID=A0A7X4HHM7_9BURK|nr:aminotransferase class I/II-fold pyridoxal phosphate-dependent enzyme [Pseudoduganella aquatica]MYN11433.1 aminotransferase class I/II-fold pyridoxal phosphate-dependent enzyme [Pseudoduganella aquatica]
MLDFTSALYLDMRHPSAAMEPWASLTLGKPAALEQPPGAAGVARELAVLLGCEAALLLPSTLHLYWDLFAMLAGEAVALLIDGGAYPIARWGAQQALSRGAPVQVFRHGDAAGLARLVRRWRAQGRRPLVLADGYSPGSEHPPPLSDYADIAARGGGWLVLDDTQPLGLLGRQGGGSVPLHGLARPQQSRYGTPVLVGASLAKAFGAPLAVLAGSAAMLGRFEERSLVRIHASPPSVAAIAAARRALRINAACGGALRQALRRRVQQFRAGLAAAGIACCGGMFPVQVVPLAPETNGPALLAALRSDGVLALLQGHRGTARLTFLLRAGHSAHDVARAVAALEHHMKELA